MKAITIKGVSKSYDGDAVVTDLDLHIPSGKFFALLGPSGCGKTTLLRLIAGLEHADKGQIFLGSQDITNVPINERKINTVFQHYALFPHLNVFENVAYPLRIKKLPADQITQRVMRALKMVQLGWAAGKSVQALSGGQKQRVALTRAIVSEPEVLLLDEPFAALDANLKERLLIDLIDLQDQLNTTFVYVTHDQREALTVADQIAIMNPQGGFEQIGTAEEIYEFPRSLFAARFVGKTNVFAGTYHVKGSQHVVQTDEVGDVLLHKKHETKHLTSGSDVYVSVRPEKISISKHTQQGFAHHLSGTVEDIVYHGHSTQYHVRTAPDRVVVVFEQNDEHFVQDEIDYEDHVELYFSNKNVVIVSR